MGLPVRLRPRLLYISAQHCQLHLPARGAAPLEDASRGGLFFLVDGRLTRVHGGASPAEPQGACGVPALSLSRAEGDSEEMIRCLRRGSGGIVGICQFTTFVKVP